MQLGLSPFASLGAAVSNEVAVDMCVCVRERGDALSTSNSVECPGNGAAAPTNALPAIGGYVKHLVSILSVGLMSMVEKVLFYAVH